MFPVWSSHSELPTIAAAPTLATGHCSVATASAGLPYDSHPSMESWKCTNRLQTVQPGRWCWLLPSNDNKMVLNGRELKPASILQTSSNTGFKKEVHVGLVGNQHCWSRPTTKAFWCWWDPQQFEYTHSLSITNSLASHGSGASFLAIRRSKKYRMSLVMVHRIGHSSHGKV